MKKQCVLFPSGFTQEVIRLFPDEPHCNYIVFEDLENKGYSIIRVDGKYGCSKNVDYNYLLTLSDDDILNIFYP